MPSVDDFTTTAKLYGPGFYLFVSLVIVVVLSMAYVVRVLYQSNQNQLDKYEARIVEKDKEIKERDEANLATLKDLSSILNTLHEDTKGLAPQLTHKIGEAEERIIKRIDLLQ